MVLSIVTIDQNFTRAMPSSGTAYDGETEQFVQTKNQTKTKRYVLQSDLYYNGNLLYKIILETYPI